MSRPIPREINREYYASDSPGRSDYWQRMAAPRSRMRTFMRTIEGRGHSSVVDLGCGSGLFLQEVKRIWPDARLCGIDFSEHLIEENRKREPGIEWRLADLDHGQDFSDGLAGAFDVVFASEIVEHLDHPDALLANAAGLARADGGLLMLSTQSGRIWETERLVGHRRHFSAAEMARLLESAGFKPERIWNEGFPFHGIAKWFANLAPRRAMEAFSGKPYGPMQKAICFLVRAAYTLNSRSQGAQLYALARRGKDEGAG